jgi:hypothetical protein
MLCYFCQDLAPPTRRLSSLFNVLCWCFCYLVLSNNFWAGHPGSRGLQYLQSKQPLTNAFPKNPKKNIIY